MKKILIVLTSLLALLCISCASSHPKMLGHEEMSHAVTYKEAIILDARKGSKWDDGQRIPGARGMNLMSTDAQISLALPDKHARIITYCGSLKCPMSKTLATRLIKLGYQHVSEYPPGIKGWKEAGGITSSAK